MWKPLIAFALALSTLTACTGEPLARTGAAADPVTLAAVWGQDPTGVGGDVLSQLIAVSADSAVSVEADRGPRAGDAEEQRAVQDLMAGDGEVTVVRAGVLQQLGADSLAPLGAPFVVSNNDQAAAIAQDPDLSQQLLADLEDFGLVGLALVPGGLRHPFAYGSEALLGPEDYRDTVINVRRDAGVEALLAQLGARADHSVDTERHLAAGTRLRGIEVSVQQVAAVTLPAVQTANVTLYEKFDVVLVRGDTWEGLSAAQQKDLRASVATAVTAAVESRLSEEDGQAAWCEIPWAASVLADAGEVSKLRAALEPVTQALAADPDSAAVLERMRELREGTSDPSPVACRAQVPASTADYYVAPRGDQSVLDGLWRLELDEQDMLDAGLTPHDAFANAGVWEFRITNGYADGVQPDGRPCNGQFAVDGNEVSFDMGVRGIEDCGGVVRGTYRLEGRRLFFDWQKELEYDVLLDQVMFAPGMVRIE